MKLLTSDKDTPGFLSLSMKWLPSSALISAFRKQPLSRLCSYDMAGPLNENEPPAALDCASA
jgi:hypothetical protein